MATMRCHLTLSNGLAPAAAFVLLAFLLVPPATAQSLPWQLCNDTAENFMEGSPYQANIRRLAAALPGNASTSASLFSAGSAGAAPDVVYALALCRGDTNASSCASCVDRAFQNAQQLCALNKGATMYDDPCILRYADWDFLANVTDNRGKYVAWSYDNVNTSMAAAAFVAASGRLVNATADFAAVDPVKRFGTGEEEFDRTYPMIYSLAQCTPDMSAIECRTCLGDIIRTITPRYFTGKHGARVFGVRCNFRFETYKFFFGRPLLQLTAPLRPPLLNMSSPAVGQGHVTRVLAIAFPSAAAILALSLACFCFLSRRTQSRKPSRIPYFTNANGIQSIDSLYLDLSTIQVATDNFAQNNKLGEGGFGAVYKGILSDGQEIAVKRLSVGSRQGVEELKTELTLVAKLQHNNLVKLVGVCLEEDEKLLVYEYMPNRSLDTILFDSQKSKELDWDKRLMIVNGVARGLQYLHEESRLKIVHRDLKPSNVLLDFDYNPKIADFGLAKLVDRDQSLIVTRHLAGTFGYMAPEYVMRGQYSVKSDVFSLGVLILEIVTGRKNCSSLSNSEEYVGLLNVVWEHWTMGTIEQLLDQFLCGRVPQDQMLKLVNIGLLCIQDSPANRPTMSSVNVMLSSNTVSLQAPSRPTFYSDAYSRAFQSSSIMSTNEGSLTELEPR